MRALWLSRFILLVAGGIAVGAACGGGGSASPSGYSLGPCDEDADCASNGLFCDTTIAACVLCSTDAQCPSGMACERNNCIAVQRCNSSSECAGRPCDTDRNRCVQCISQGDCLAGHTCNNGSCQRTCSSDNDCGGLKCDFNLGVCVQCRTDSDCGELYFCNSSYCAPDRCAPGRQGCVQNWIVECSSSGSQYQVEDDCAGQTCVEAASGPVCEGVANTGGTAGTGGSTGGTGGTFPTGGTGGTGGFVQTGGTGGTTPTIPCGTTGDYMDYDGTRYTEASFGGGDFNCDPYVSGYYSLDDAETNLALAWNYSSGATAYWLDWFFITLTGSPPTVLPATYNVATGQVAVSAFFGDFTSFCIAESGTVNITRFDAVGGVVEGTYSAGSFWEYETVCPLTISGSFRMLRDADF